MAEARSRLTLTRNWLLLAGDASPDAAVTAVLIVLSALAMGVQSAAIHRLEVSGIATTYITGTLTNLVSRLMGRANRKSKPVFKHAALLAAVRIVYLGGAVAAAVILHLHSPLARMLPAALILLMVIIAAAAFRPR